MADVRFILPYNKITGVDRARISAKNCRELCQKIIEQYGEEMSFLLDDMGNVSKSVTIFYNDRNIYTLQGSDTKIEEEAEIIIMPHFHMA